MLQLGTEKEKKKWMKSLLNDIINRKNETIELIQIEDPHRT